MRRCAWHALQQPGAAWGIFSPAHTPVTSHDSHWHPHRPTYSSSSRRARLSLFVVFYSSRSADHRTPISPRSPPASVQSAADAPLDAARRHLTLLGLVQHLARSNHATSARCGSMPSSSCTACADCTHTDHSACMHRSRAAAQPQSIRAQRNAAYWHVSPRIAGSVPPRSNAMSGADDRKASVKGHMVVLPACSFAYLLHGQL